MFSGYAANVLTNMLGLQGWSNLVAMQRLDGKRNPLLPLSAWAWAGQGLQPVLDGDVRHVLGHRGRRPDQVVRPVRCLAHQPVRPSASWPAASGSVRRGRGGPSSSPRRTACRARATWYDPRKIENDFRNSGGRVLDNLPFGLSALAGPVRWPARRRRPGHPPDRHAELDHRGCSSSPRSWRMEASYFETGDIRQVQAASPTRSARPSR